jgi:LysM repeat protein
MNSGILGRIQGYLSSFAGLGLRFGIHCVIMKVISTTIQKLKNDYKPLGVAIFLAVGGLVFGLIGGSFFPSNSAGMVQERRVPGGPTLIPQAEGAEIDSAALTPQSAPFVASADAGSASALLAENVDVLYNEGALRDPEQVIKTQTTVPTANAPKSFAAGVIYTVANGDTLSSISTTFNVPIDMIVEFNPSVNFSALVPGISIVIPSQNSISALAG